jgi:hypothetical protein
MILASTLRLLAACGALVMLLGAAPVSAQIKEFGEHWTAACDNQRHCSVYGVHYMWTPGYIRIDRAGTPEAPTKVVLAIRQDRKAKFTLELDEEAPGILPEGTITPDRVEPDHFMRFTIEAPIESVVAALRKAKTIIYKPVEPIDQDVKHYDGEIVLTGAIQALAWIDAQQKRTGTVTALVKRGDKPATAIPPVPELPVVTAVKSTEESPPAGRPRVVVAKSRTVCGKGDRTGEIRQATWLDDKHVMYWFFCMGSSGAYNLSHALLAAPLGNPGAGRTLELRYPPSIAAVEKSRVDNIYNPEFERATGLLWTVHHGRAAADCGTVAKWAWDGSAFRLVMLQKMPVCGGIEPYDWPVLYRAEVK